MQDQAQSAASQAGTAVAYIIMIGFIGALVFAMICTFMAMHRGRSAGLGFVGGFFFGLFAVIYYLIAGDSVEHRVAREEDARARYREERR